MIQGVTLQCSSSVCKQVTLSLVLNLCALLIFILSVLKVSGVFYNGPCSPGGPCPNFLSFEYDFLEANTTEETINSRASQVRDGLAQMAMLG